MSAESHPAALPWRSVVLLIVATAVVTAAVTLVVLRGGSSRAEDPGPEEPIGTVADIMRMLDPSADAIWGSVGFVITPDGEEVIAPAGEEEWQRLESHAVTLMAAGRLLEIPGPGADREWNGHARALVQAGRETFAVLRTRDKDALLAVGEQITNACDACHQRYWDDTDVLVDQ
jgi:hypothetical protein